MNIEELKYEIRQAIRLNSFPQGEYRDIEKAVDKFVGGLVAELQTLRDRYAKINEGETGSIMALEDVIKLLDHLLKELGANKDE